MKRIFKISTIVFLFVLNISFLFLLKPAKFTSTSDLEKTGKIVVTVLESNSNKPIDNATVCVIEDHKYYSTNKCGLTNLIHVPLITNTNFDLSLKRDWGEVTLLIYKPGYADCINFYTSIPSNATRVGVVIYLSPIYNDSDNVPTINSESPNNAYAKELIKLYKK